MSETEVLLSNDVDAIIKEEPRDSGYEATGNDDVVYVGTEIIIKYLEGDLSLDQFSALMEDGVKDDDDDVDDDNDDENLQGSDDEDAQCSTTKNLSPSKSQSSSKSVEVKPKGVRYLIKFFVHLVLRVLIV